MVVRLKYVLICFISENDRSLVALVAGRTRSSFASLVTSGNSIFWLLFFQKFTNASNSFVIDILLVSKKGVNWPNWTVMFSQWKFFSCISLSILRESSIFVTFLVNCFNENIFYVFADFKISLVEALLNLIPHGWRGSGFRTPSGFLKISQFVKLFFFPNYLEN